jgi:hypothetical protein
MPLVERMAPEIARDFSDVIAVIRGSADLVKLKLEVDHPATIDVERIIRASEEAAALTRELRSLVLHEEPV